MGQLFGKYERNTHGNLVLCNVGITMGGVCIRAPVLLNISSPITRNPVEGIDTCVI